MAFRRQTGGRKAATHRPNESELVALTAAYAMVLCHCGGDLVKSHSETISNEVYRAGGSTQEWSHDEVSTHMQPHELSPPHMHARPRTHAHVHVTCTRTKPFDASVIRRCVCPQIYNYVKETMFRYMPTMDVRKWLEKLMSNNDQDETAMKDTMFAFIQSCVISAAMQKTTSKFSNKRAVEALFERAKLDKILKIEEIGGEPTWSSENLMKVADENENLVYIWEVMNMSTISELIHDWLRNMKAYADGVAEDEWYKYAYTGNRKLVARNESEIILTVHKGEKRKKGMGDLDETGQGIKESFQRQAELLRQPPWSGLDAAAVVKKILSPTEGEAGEQGGKLLASYLVLKKDEFMPIQRFGGVVGFLEANLDHYKQGDVAGTTSEATQLVMHALKFATILIPELAAAARAAEARDPIFQPAPPAARRGLEPLFDVQQVQQPASHRRSAAFSAALPGRTGASTTASRAATRDRVMRLTQRTGAAVGFAQASAEASTLLLLDVRSDKAPGSRGRMMGEGQLKEGLRQVSAKLRTSRLRTNFHSNDSVLVDDDAASDEDEGEGGGGWVRGDGGRVVATEHIQLPAGASWSRALPAAIKAGQIVATVHFDPRGQPAWYDAIVIKVQTRRYNHGAQDMLHLYFLEDGHNDWYSLPDRSIAFNHGTKATSKELKAARAAVADA